MENRYKSVREIIDSKIQRFGQEQARAAEARHFRNQGGGFELKRMDTSGFALDESGLISRDSGIERAYGSVDSVVHRTAMQDSVPFMRTSPLLRKLEVHKDRGIARVANPISFIKGIFGKSTIEEPQSPIGDFRRGPNFNKFLK